MLDEALQEILGKIEQEIKDANPNLSPSDIFEKIKNELKVLEKDEYIKWQNENFKLDYAFTFKRDESTYQGTLLHISTDYALENAVNALLAINGIKVNAIDKHGYTPLHIAARNGYINIINALLKAEGIEVNAAVKTLEDTALHLAVKNGNLYIINVLLAKEGIDINAADMHGNTPLHYASNKNGHIKVVKALLEAKAKVNAVDKHGNTPLHCSANADVVNALLAAGAEVNAKNENEQTPLHWAANADIVNALMAKGAEVNAVNQSGETPLHYAARRNDVNIIDTLLKAGAEVNAAGEGGYGQTPLHCAATADAVKALIEAKAEVNAKDEDEDTPLHWAARKNDVKLVKALLAEGADINAKNKNGKTAVDLAIHDSIKKLLKTAKTKQFTKPIIIGCIVGYATTVVLSELATLLIKKEHLSITPIPITLIAIAFGFVAYAMLKPSTQITEMPEPEKGIESLNKYIYINSQR